MTHPQRHSGDVNGWHLLRQPVPSVVWLIEVCQRHRIRHVDDELPVGDLGQVVQADDGLLPVCPTFSTRAVRDVNDVAVAVGVDVGVAC